MEETMDSLDVIDAPGKPGARVLAARRSTGLPSEAE